MSSDPFQFIKQVGAWPAIVSGLTRLRRASDEQEKLAAEALRWRAAYEKLRARVSEPPEDWEQRVKLRTLKALKDEVDGKQA